MNGDMFGVVEAAKRMAESTLGDAKRSCDAMFDKVKKDSEALLDDTKVKCDKMIDEAGGEALAIMKQKLRAWAWLFASVMTVLLGASFTLGYFAGRG